MSIPLPSGSAGQPFPEQVAPGGVLVYPAIKSPNFIHGSSGWSINADGSNEFNNGIFRGTITAGTFEGTNFVIDPDGAFWYSGTPANGNLILSLADAAGTDPFGNAYPQGLGVAAGQIPGGLINNGTITPSKISALTASLIGNLGVLNSNPYFQGGDGTGWNGFNGTFSVATPPAGAPFAFAGRYVNNGVTAGAMEESAIKFAVTPGQQYLVTAWVNATAATVRIGFDWTNNGSFVSTGTQDFTVTPNTWTQLTTVQTAPASGVNGGYPRIGFPTANGATVFAQAITVLPQVPGSLIQAGTVTANQIAAGTITAALIAAGTITGGNIAANTITGGNIAANTVTSANIAANTITAAQLAAGIVYAGIINGTTVNAATFTGSTFNGTDFIMNSAGSFFYSGTPAAGNLILSIAPAAGTDAFGNAYLAGTTSYSNDTAGDFIQFIAGLLVFGNTANPIGGGAATINYQPNGELMIQGGGGGLAGTLLFTQQGIGASPGVVQVPQNQLVGTDASGSPAAWQPVSLTGAPSGTTGTARVKLLPLQKMAVLDIEIGFTTLGAQGNFSIGSLPSSAYYPLATRHYAPGLAGTATGTPQPRLFIPTSGALQLVDIPAGASGFGITVMYPLD